MFGKWNWLGGRRLGGGDLALRGAGLLAGAYVVKRILDARRAHLDGKVVLITGGSRGLGLLLAREFGRAGCRLAICARDGAELERARLGLERRGFEVLATVCDVAQPAEVAHLIEEVLDRYGRLDVLVNNASIIQVGALESMTRDDFKQAMEINFFGTLNTTLAALDALKRQPGARLVNICSIGGKVAMPHLLPYDCAKFAVLGLSEGLRAELAASGVSVTTVIPSLMRTGSYANAQFKGDQLQEFAWFATLAQEPATSMDARKAARLIVRATALRQAELILGWQARLLSIAKALLPSAVVSALAVANRALPAGERNTAAMSGQSLAVNPARYS